MNSTKIILIGYMGSGKSVIGSKLSEALGIQFIDLDDAIESAEGTVISKIFESKGELYFRQLERKCLEQLLELPEPMVLSLGGGTPCYYDNMEFILQQKKRQELLPECKHQHLKSASF